MFDYRESAGKIKRKYKKYENFGYLDFFHLNTDATYLNVKNQIKI